MSVAVVKSFINNHIYIYIYIYIYISYTCRDRDYIYIYALTHKYVYTWTRIRARVCAYMCNIMYACTCVRIYACTRAAGAAEAVLSSGPVQIPTNFPWNSGLLGMAARSDPQKHQ